ncbi:MAG: response regulator transcription factor [Melioribacteraceae bacterium]|nr:response regulator transcription factor [Melioribacteraceae bacterium]MCF8395343.1 response regulator transcription factor [Melioribacteraceae bacterium]MCF8418776.1 response regulator transcription factor [Melioribacteraceae bacterium]
MKILIADDHEIVRQGLKTLLKNSSIRISKIDEAEDGREAESMILENNYDIVILDISMPHMTGIEILNSLRKEKYKTKVMILSMHPQEQYAIRALKAGAKGYITKDSAAEELITAIEKVSSGSRYVSPEIADKLIDQLAEPLHQAPHEKLSARELHVMCMLGEGKTISEIAEELFISVKTVSTYRARIMQKMNMKKNAELSLYCIQNNLIEV